MPHSRIYGELRAREIKRTVKRLVITSIVTVAVFGAFEAVMIAHVMLVIGVI